MTFTLQNRPYQLHGPGSVKCVFPVTDWESQIEPMYLAPVLAQLISKRFESTSSATSLCDSNTHDSTTISDSTDDILHAVSNSAHYNPSLDPYNPVNLLITVSELFKDVSCIIKQHFTRVKMIEIPSSTSTTISTTINDYDVDLPDVPYDIDEKDDDLMLLLERQQKKDLYEKSCVIWKDVEYLHFRLREWYLPLSNICSPLFVPASTTSPAAHFNTSPSPNSMPNTSAILWERVLPLFLFHACECRLHIPHIARAVIQRRCESSGKKDIEQDDLIYDVDVDYPVLNGDNIKFMDISVVSDNMTRSYLSNHLNLNRLKKRGDFSRVQDKIIDSLWQALDPKKADGFFEIGRTSAELMAQMNEQLLIRSGVKWGNGDNQKSIPQVKGEDVEIENSLVSGTTHHDKIMTEGDHDKFMTEENGNNHDAFNDDSLLSKPFDASSSSISSKSPNLCQIGPGDVEFGKNVSSIVAPCLYVSSQILCLLAELASTTPCSSMEGGLSSACPESLADNQARYDTYLRWMKQNLRSVQLICSRWYISSHLEDHMKKLIKTVEVKDWESKYKKS